MVAIEEKKLSFSLYGFSCVGLLEDITQVVTIIAEAV